MHQPILVVTATMHRTRTKLKQQTGREKKSAKRLEKIQHLLILVISSSFSWGGVGLLHSGLSIAVLTCSGQGNTSSEGHGA